MDEGSTPALLQHAKHYLSTLMSPGAKQPLRTLGATLTTRFNHLVGEAAQVTAGK